MLDGLFLLLGLSIVMAMASFLAGALPLSMSLSPSQLRLISTVGMGVLVGTSLIVIIPEGIETLYTSGWTGNSHERRGLSLYEQTEQAQNIRMSSPISQFQTVKRADVDAFHALPGIVIPEDIGEATPKTGKENADPADPNREKHNGPEPPTFYVGLSLILGFVLMFLIDKLPRHASEKLQPPPTPRHISLSNLSQSVSVEQEEESESFLQSLTPNAKQTRSLATTTGLVIHAAADGIAMGASASTANIQLGLIIFLAIMLHKAPAAFGLTSVLLKQGLSKRAARGHLIIFSLAAPFGALTTWLIVHLLGGGGISGERGKWWTGMLLLFSAGTFLYVAMHAMQDDSGGHDHPTSNGFTESGSQRKQPGPQMRDTLAAVAGMLLPMLTQFGHHH